MDQISSALSPIQAKTGMEPYQIFLQRVRNQMHVVLALSPVGNSLRTRMRMFPSLVNCSTIDWLK
jgi:dynein heavy chain